MRFWSALLVGGVVALALGALEATGVLEPLELKTRDMRMRGTIPETKERHDEIVLVVVSDACIEALRGKSSWPWDRRLFADLFRACGSEEFPATVILFDFFTHVDRDPYKGEPAMIEAMGGASPVHLAVPFKVEGVASADKRPGLDPLLDRHAIRVDNDGSVEIPERYASVLLPVKGVAEAAAGICDVSTPRDRDGVLRRYRLFSTFRGRTYPSFALAALMAREGVDVVTVRNRTLTVGSLSFPVERDGTIRLRYRSPGDSFHLLWARDVLEGLETFEKEKRVGKFDPSFVCERIVIMGTNAAALYDLKVTPVVDVMPGLEVHAVALANLIDGKFMRAVPAWVTLLLVAALALAASMITRFAPPLTGAAAVAVLLAGYGTLNVLLFRARWEAGMVAPLGAGLLSYAATSAVNFFVEGRRRLQLRREFQRYLSPRVVEKILANPQALRLEGERKTLTVFFLDFEGFTSLSEKLSPGELVHLISDYHEEAAREIFATEGTIDKYIGDAIMAFWNDPIDQPDHALRACRAGLGAQRRLRDLAARMRERGLSEMRARIGINTGPATVGDMGARGQVNYTALGDEVNLASRLEGVNKLFGTEILVSEATWEGAKGELKAREIALVQVKGRNKPVRIFELIGDASPERLEGARTFERGLEAFRARRFGEAREIFAALPDAASAFYVRLCARYEEEPPPGEWEGSIRLETK
jgi:adenylate cyclase